MANSYVEYTGDGATTTFVVPFPYLEQEHVEVYIDDVLTASYTWPTSGQITFDTAPANGADILIQRVTPINPLVDFTAKSRWLSMDLNTAIKQALYRAEESSVSGLALATSSMNGLMSAADKQWLDEVRTFNPMDYGAIGDGVTDDTAAVQACLDAAVASTGPFAHVEISRLHKIAGSGVTYAYGPTVLISGKGKDAVGFTGSPTNAQTLFTWRSDAPSTKDYLVMRNITFIKDNSTVNQGTALRVVRDMGDSSDGNGCIIEYCTFNRGNLGGNFLQAIILEHVPGTYIQNCTFTGRGTLTSNKLGSAIEVRHWCSGLYVVHNVFRGFKHGVYVTDQYNQTTIIATEGQTVFSVPWCVAATNDLHVYVNGSAYTYTAGTPTGTQYSITGVGVTPAGSASITLGTAATAGDTVYIDGNFECEGFQVLGNRFANLDHGIRVDIDQVEIAWRIIGNAIDTSNTSIWLRNLSKFIIANNSLYHNGQDETKSDIKLVRTDGSRYGYGTDGETLDPTGAHQGIITGNMSDRTGDIRLNISAVTNANPAVMTFTVISADGYTPANDDLFYLDGGTGMTELNKRVVKLQNVTATTAELVDYKTNTAINSTAYGVYTGNLKGELFTCFLEVQSGTEVHAFNNIIQGRYVGLYAWDGTDTINYVNNPFKPYTSDPLGEAINSSSTGVDNVIADFGSVAIADGSIQSAKLGVDITTAGKTLLTAADAAAQLALLSAAAATHTHVISDVTNLQTTLDGKAASSHTHAISDVTNLQTTLDGKAASSHTHAISDVTNLQTTLDGKAASSHTHSISDVTSLQTSLDAKVAGPASATDNAIARFDATTGKLIQNSTATVDDSGNISGSKTLVQAGSAATPAVTFTADPDTGIYRDAANVIAIATGGAERVKISSTEVTVTGNIAVTGTVDGRDVATDGATLDSLGTTVSGKLNSSAVSAFMLTVLDDADAAAARTTLGAAASSHSHAISDVTNLQTTLDGKAASSHSHAISDVTGLQTALDGKAASSHTHTASQVTDFNSAADARIAAASINALSDVAITSPSNGQVLKYNGTNWANGTDETGGGGVSDGDKGDIVVSLSGTVWEFDSSVVTAAGRALLDDANNTAQRSTLGLGSAAVENVGTSGSVIGKLDTNNVWVGTQTFGDGAGAEDITVNGGAASLRGVKIQTAGVNRWMMLANSIAESGSNAGSNFAIRSFDDAGTLIENPLQITRSTGVTTLKQLELTTDLAITEGGTGASDAATARSNLGAAAASHTHAISDVTGLQTALDNKLDDSQASAFGLTLIDDADASAARTTLGLKTGATVAIHVGTTAPGSPATGDLWVDTN